MQFYTAYPLFQYILKQFGQFCSVMSVLTRSSRLSRPKQVWEDKTQRWLKINKYVDHSYQRAEIKRISNLNIFNTQLYHVETFCTS